MKLKKILSAAAAAAIAVTAMAASVFAAEIWSGSNDLGTTWDGEKALTIEAGDLADTKEGEELVITFTTADVADYYNLQLLDGSWTKLTGPVVNDWGSIEVSKSDTSYSVILNADDAAAIKEKGLVVFGYALDIKKVEIGAPAPKAAEPEEAEEAEEPEEAEEVEEEADEPEEVEEEEPEEVEGEPVLISETAPAPVETAAPAVETTAPAQTGNTAAAAIAAVCAAAGAAALLSRKRK